MNNPHHNNAPNNPGQNRAASYAEVLKHNGERKAPSLLAKHPHLCEVFWLTNPRYM